MLAEEERYQHYEDIPEVEIETRYIYIYDEDPEKPHWKWPEWEKVSNLLLQLLALAMMAGFCLIPGQPAYIIQTIRVPAHFLPVQMIQASVAIVPTGVKQYPATRSSGILTIYNGSILQETLPAGLIVNTSLGGVEIATDQAVTIPAGNPPTYGIATVSAHAVVAGSKGNIATYSINQVDGTSLVIKNLSAFTGGQDARTEQYVTSEDRAKALEEARAQGEQNTPRGLQARPCTETDTQEDALVSVTLSCQLITYQAPQLVQVLKARVQGDTVILIARKVILPQ